MYSLGLAVPRIFRVAWAGGGAACLAQGTLSAHILNSLLKCLGKGAPNQFFFVCRGVVVIDFAGSLTMYLRPWSCKIQRQRAASSPKYRRGPNFDMSGPNFCLIF